MTGLSFWPYVALVLILAVSSAGPPLPATLSLTVATVAARQGHTNLALLVVVATLATVAGDLIGYTVGRLIGPALGRGIWGVQSSGRRLSGRIAAARAWVDARAAMSGPLVFVSRWGLTPIAPAINVIVGARRYPFRLFVAWDSAGEALWVARVALPAYALGKTAGLGSVPIALGATLVLGALIAFGAGRLWQPAAGPPAEDRSREDG